MDSILDKVLSRKEDQEKEAFNPVDVVNALLKGLTSKEADVVRRRYGLGQEGKETLEMIGERYKVTRERIRQIENLSIEKMKTAPQFFQIMKPVEHLVTSLVDHHGGVMGQEMLYDNLLDVHASNGQYRLALFFLLSKLLDKNIDELPKTKQYVPGWKLTLISLDFVAQAIAALEQLISSIGKPQTFDQLYEKFQHTEFYKQHEPKLSASAVSAYADISAHISKNPFDEYGLSTWGLIVPKRMNDRVYLVLQKEGKPMHFEEIARRISVIFKKTAYPPTVHNELILNPEYVLVGRGMYALKEWGYKEGVVAHVIVDVLQAANKPLDRAEIVQRVLQQRIVKKNTIHLALTDKTLFQKIKNGKYTLAQQTASSTV